MLKSSIARVAVIVMVATGCLVWSGTLADVSSRFATEAEKRKIMLALKQANGDKGRASDILAINFKTLAAKLRQYGLD